MFDEKLLEMDLVESLKGSTDAIAMYLMLNEKWPLDQVLSIYVLTKAGLDPLIIGMHTPLIDINFHYTFLVKSNITSGYQWIIQDKIEISNLAVEYLEQIK